MGDGKTKVISWFWMWRQFDVCSSFDGLVSCNKRNCQQKIESTDNLFEKNFSFTRRMKSQTKNAFTWRLSISSYLNLVHRFWPIYNCQIFWPSLLLQMQHVWVWVMGMFFVSENLIILKIVSGLPIVWDI